MLSTHRRYLRRRMPLKPRTSVGPPKVMSGDAGRKGRRPGGTGREPRRLTREPRDALVVGRGMSRPLASGPGWEGG